MAYSSRLELQVDSRSGERSLRRFRGELEGVERRGRSTVSTMDLLRRSAGPLAAALGGVFTVSTLRNQIAFADELQKINIRIGASTEALSQYNYVAKLSGVQFNQLTTAWQRQTRRIAEAAQGTGAAKDALEQLNLSAAELSRLAPEDQFERIAGAMQGVSSASERTALAMKLWDTEGVKLVQIVNQGADAIERMKAEADSLGLTISQRTADDMASFNDEMDRLAFAARGVSQTMLAELVPSLTAGLQATSELIDEAGGAASILDTVKVSAGGVATIMAGRLAGSVGTAAAAKLAATRQTIAYQAALARMAGVSTTAAAAQTALAGATRAASGALALVGGPLGAAVIAAGAIYTFREELGLTQQQTGLTTDELADLRAELDDMNRDDLGASLDTLNTRLEQATLMAATAREELAALRAEENRGAGVLGFGAGEVGAEVRGMQAVANAEAKLAEIKQRRSEVQRELNERDEEGVERLDDMTVTAERAAGGMRENAEATTAAADAAAGYTDELQALRRRLQPGYAEAERFARGLNTVNLALAAGRISMGEYADLVRMLQGEMQGADDSIRDLGDTNADTAQEMSREWERFGNSVDDTFADAFRGAFDSFEDFADQLKGAFENLLAELAYAAVKNEIKISLGMQGSGPMSGGIGSIFGGGQGGGFGGIGGLVNGAKSLFGFGSTASTGATAYAGSGWASSATSASAAGSAGWMSSAMSMAPQIAAMYALNQAADGLLERGGVYDALGIDTSGQAAQLGGQFAGLGGKVIGSGLDSIGKALGFTSDTKPGFNLDTVDTLQGRHSEYFENQPQGVYAEGALGVVGFNNHGTQRLKSSFGGFDKAREFLEQIAVLDNLVASLASNKDDLAAMQEAVQSMNLRGGSPKDIANQLTERTDAALDALGGQFGEFVDSLSGGIEEVVAKAQAGRQAFAILSNAATHLNLRFDDSADGAYQAAASLAEMAGGAQNLASVQQGYYQAYFTEAERAAHLQADLTAEFAKYGAQLPETRAEFRAMVEAQDLNTAAGREAYVALMNVAGAFDELKSSANETSQALKAREDMERQLLKIQGDTQALRQLEIDQLKEVEGWEEAGLVALQERIWSLQDAAEAEQEAARQAEKRARAMERAESQMARVTTGIEDWLAGLRGTEQGMGSPSDQLRAAQSDFASQLARAESGDRSALQSITKYADRYLKAGQGMYASGSGAQSIRNEIESALEQLPDALSAEEFLAEEFRGTIDGQTSVLSQALDLNRDGTVSAIEELISSGMDRTDRLAVVLDQEMGDLGARVLTEAQVRSALAPHATNAEIDRLIDRVDVNGDGLLSAQELANARLDGLATGIGSALEPMFDSIDLDTDGLIDYDEFGRQFSGMATDSQLRRIFNKLDKDGNGQISRLEAIKGTNQDIRNNAVNDLLRENPLLDKGLRSIDKWTHNTFKAVNNLTSKLGHTPYANGGAFMGGTQAFANGGAFTNSIVSQPTTFDMGLMGEAGPEAIMPLTRHNDGSLGVRAELPALPPLLGQGDVVEVLQDLRREVAQLRRENAQLQGEGNKHAAASVQVQQAGFTRQIDAQERANRSLDEMGANARLEASR